jgi:hypothetical protein
VQEECIYRVIQEEGNGALDTVAMTIMKMIMIIMIGGGEEVDVQAIRIFLGVIEELEKDQ